MADYESFTKKMSPFDKNLFPHHKVIEYYLKKNGLPVVDIERYGYRYISFQSPDTIDQVVEWIMEGRKQLANNEFVV